MDMISSKGLRYYHLKQNILNLLIKFGIHVVQFYRYQPNICNGWLGKWTGPLAYLRPFSEVLFSLMWYDKPNLSISGNVDLKPELGSGLPGRWKPRPTLPRSRVTSFMMQVGDPRMAKIEVQAKKNNNTLNQLQDANQMELILDEAFFQKLHTTILHLSVLQCSYWTYDNNISPKFGHILEDQDIQAKGNNTGSFQYPPS